MEITLKTAAKPAAPHRIVPVFTVGKASAKRKAQKKGAPTKSAGADFGAAGATVGATVARAARALAGVGKFSGEQGQTLLLPQGARIWLFTGLGPPGELTRPAFCEAVGRALAELRKAGAEDISLVLPAGLPWPARQAARYAGEALLMAGYAFNVYRSKPNGPPPCRVELVAPGGAAARRAGVAEAEVVGGGIALARDLINQPAGVAHTDFMLEQAQTVAREVRAKTRQIRGDELLEQGYGALHAVGRSAGHPPALVALEYGRAKQARPTLALVGKGVVFDSGGLDLKTSGGMALMKKDMGGAAIVLGAFRAIAALGLPLRVVCVLGLAENMVGPDAYHPGDILRTKAGPTVEITNTDAEGRLVLADAMALALEYEPDYLVDFATLTGACRVALGKELMGLFCDHEPLRRGLVAAAEATGEHLWPLPLWKPYRAKLDSQVADLVNAASDGLGGAITAALFLREFVGDVAWAHLDCYGWSEGENPLFPKGGSGGGVRLMVDLATRIGNGELA